MRLLLLRISLFLLATVISALTLHAQNDTTQPTSVDPKLLEWQNAKIAKEYTIASISITGIKYLDTAIVLSISSLQVGDKFVHPGNEIFAKAINNLWRQKLFANIQIYVTKIQGENVSIEINVQEHARLGNFKFVGVKKSEQEDLQGKIGLVKQTIITENMRRNIVEVTKKYYADKGFQDVNVRIDEKPDTAFLNSNRLVIYVDKGKKVHINEVNFFGNKNVDGLKLKKQMKNTKEMSKMTLYPSKDKSPFGEKKYMSIKEYVKEWGFLSVSETKKLLDPYFRFQIIQFIKI